MRRNIQARFSGGRRQLEPSITEKEVFLVVGEITGGKATGPDKLPSDAYKNLPGTQIFTHMLEGNFIPPELCRYLIAPLDKIGKDPGLRSGKRPISLLNAFMKAL